jgi:integrase/recombinase XerD
MGEFYMNLREEAIIKVLGKSSLDIQGLDQLKLRNILEEVLSEYEVGCLEKSLVVSDLEEKLNMYLIVRKLDGIADKTLENYRREILKLSEIVYKPVSMITTFDIRRYLAGIYNKVKIGTYATKISTLKTFFSWLVDQEILEKDPMKSIKTPNIDKRVRKALSQEELEIMRSCCKSPRESALLDFFYSTGCRLSEVVSVNTSQIDWYERSLFVIGKGNKERKVYFSVRAKVLLEEYLKTRNDNEDALFVTQRAPIGRLGNRGVQKVIKAVGTRSGINKNVFCHILRHTMATQAINSDVSLSSLQRLLGHNSADTTLIYAKISDDQVKQEYKKIS